MVAWHRNAVVVFKRENNGKTLEEGLNFEEKNIVEQGEQAQGKPISRSTSKWTADTRIIKRPWF